MDELPSWAAMLPAVNAGLNGLAGIMLAVGYCFIKRGLRVAHARTMIAATPTYLRNMWPPRALSRLRCAWHIQIHLVEVS